MIVGSTVVAIARGMVEENRSSVVLADSERPLEPALEFAKPFVGQQAPGGGQCSLRATRTWRSPLRDHRDCEHGSQRRVLPMFA